MRPLLRRPRFKEKNKKENKQTSFPWLCRKKKKPNASDVPALPPAALRKELSKKQVAAASHFFSGWWLSHDWICWVMRCLSSQVILLEKIRETLGPQTKTNTECMQSTPLKKSGVFVELLASFPWLHGELQHTAHTVAERVVLCRGAWFWNKILQDATAENLDKQWIRITGTRDAPALAPPALQRKK